jgi:hypothetical protein
LLTFRTGACAATVVWDVAVVALLSGSAGLDEGLNRATKAARAEIRSMMKGFLFSEEISIEVEP